MLKPGIIQPRLRNRLRIKIGGMKKRGDKEYPEKYDHFKLTTTEKDDQGNWIPVTDNWLMEHIGDVKPKELPFMFFSNDPRMCFDTGYAYQTRQGRRCYSEDGDLAWWAKKKPVKKGDKWTDGPNPVPEGIKTVPVAGLPPEQSRMLDDYEPVLCMGQECPMQKMDPANCKLNLRLSGFIPVPEGRFEGQDILWSTSYNSASQIMGSWETLMLQTGGQPAFIPLKLKLEPKKGKRGEIYILSFHVDVSRAEIDAIVAGAAAAGRGAIGSGLTPPPAVDLGEHERAEEFYEGETVPEEDDNPSLADMMPKTTGKEVGTVEGKPPESSQEPAGDKKTDSEPLDHDKMDMSNLKDFSEKQFERLDELCKAISVQMEAKDKTPNQITNATQTALRDEDPIKSMEALLNSFMPDKVREQEGEPPEQQEL